MSWTLRYLSGATDVTKTFADWGFTGLRIERATQAAGVATWRAPMNFDAADLFDLSTAHAIVIALDGVVKFCGSLSESPRSGDGGSEVIQFTAKDAWYLLENTIYFQKRKSWDINANAQGESFTPHAWLGFTTDNNGQYLKTDEVLNQLLTYAQAQAAAAGYRFKFDLAGAPSFEFPVCEVHSATVAECVKTVLRWCPDAVTWWDYSTVDGNGLPSPTFHCKRRAGLLPVSVDVTGGGVDPVSAVKVTPRYDLLREVVAIHYEVAFQSDGNSYMRVVSDIYPPSASGREVFALSGVVNMQGANTTTLSQPCTVEDMNALHSDDTLRLAWWKAQFPELADADVTLLQIDLAGCSRSGVKSLPRWLVDGGIADWMSVQYEEETVTAKIFFRNKAGSQTVEKVVQLVSTDAVTQTYQTNYLLSTGEPIPANLAREIWNAVSVLHWQGEITLVEQEASGKVGLGNVINLTGGKAAWTTMNALIFRETIDADAGKTTVEFGTPEHLGIGDTIELLRAMRTRKLWTFIPSLLNAGAGNGGNLILPIKNAKADKSGETASRESMRTQFPT